MKKEDKGFYKEVAKEVAKLDHDTQLMILVSAKMLVARQEMDKKPGPETAA